MSESFQNKKPIIGITVGDINGVGPEIIIKSLEDARILKQLTPVIYGSSKVVSYYKKAFEKESFNYIQIKSLDKISHKQVNVFNVWSDPVEITPGQANEIGGKYALLSLKAAVEDLTSRKIDAMTTAPLSKELTQSDDFQFPGHTEFLTEKAQVKDSLMFLISENIKVGVATGHIPLKDVCESVTKEKISSKLSIMLSSLQQDFGIKKPRIAVLGLNPHAGENGLLGEEEKKTIAPVIDQFRNEHHLVYGPYPSDGFFGAREFRKFDGVLAIYHDQGLIPFKTIAFEEGVNYTAGLPFIRTSPDHGTAFSIAGKNEADERSIRNALFLANDIARNRRANEFISHDKRK